MKILVVDDHVLIREALRWVLGELQPGAEIVEAADAGSALRRLSEHPEPELVVLDLYLPDGNGLDLLARLREDHPAVPVTVLSVSSERGDISRALELGAVGFIPKSAPREVMLGAFRLIFAGGVYIPREILGRPRLALAVPPEPGRPPTAAELGLTERQFEVLGLLVQGKSNKAICRALDLAEPTVKNHVTAILKALRVGNRTEAALAATALGLGRRKDAG